MKGIDLISIIVPVYGVEQYLSECVDSILEQTYGNLEVLLVDDASPDNCGVICDAYAAKDSRVKVIHKPNGGAASARNAGLDIATGEYICFVDSDDVVSPDYVATLLEQLAAADADIAVCGFTHYSRAGKTICMNREPSGEYDRLGYLRQFLNSWTCALLWNKIFRRETIGNIRMAEGHRIDDEFFTYQLVLNARRIVVFDKPLYHYRLRSSSVMQDSYANGGRLMMDRIEYMQQKYGHICELAPELKADFFADLVDSYARYWAGCARIPEAEKRIRSWTKGNLGAIVMSQLTWKQKLIYIHGLFLKKPGSKDLNEHLPSEDQPFFE